MRNTGILTSIMLVGLAIPVFGQEETTQKKITEPVFRVSKLSSANKIPEPSSTVKSIESYSNPTYQPPFDPFAEPAPPRPLTENVNVSAEPKNSASAMRNVSHPTPVLTVANPVATNSASIEATTPSAKLIADPNAIPSAATAPTKPVHPLDSAIDQAYQSLTDMRSEVFDYTAILAKRENVNGSLTPTGFMQLKVRCPRETPNGNTPFSIYMKFLKPRDSAGREVIWVQGQNDNKLVAHEGTGRLIGMRRFNLDPTGWLAMKGNRYPIYEVGLENLIVKLIEKAERDRAAGPCEVVYREGANIKQRPCKVIELTHDERRAPYEFHKAQVFIDEELKLPVRYAAYDWPTAQGADPVLQEEYTYFNIKTNVGLTDLDFNPDNPAYGFPRK